MIRRSAKATNRIDLNRFIADCHRFLRAPRTVRERIEEAGVTLLAAGLHSPIPRLQDLESTFGGSDGDRRPLYSAIFDRARIAAYLQAMQRFADEFDPPLTSDPARGTQYFWDNPQFSYTDAVAYYCMVRWLRPRRIVEIGGGFSTLIASSALQRNGFGEIVCIDPAPYPFIADVPTVSRIIQAPLQKIALDDLSNIMATTDLLFTDTTHTVKIGSDCLYIYLVLLPSLTAPLVVHSHDIFLPYGMPLNWARDHQLHWTEQYLLYAYLLHNNRAAVLFGSAYASEFLAEETRLLMHNRYPVGGGSLWFQINADEQAGFVPI